MDLVRVWTDDLHGEKDSDLVAIVKAEVVFSDILLLRLLC